MLDRIAHDYCDGRWLATGGGGYDAYRVVPRSWSLVWLAQAHREVPGGIAGEWRAKWQDEAQRYDQAPLPESYLDPHNLVAPDSQDLAGGNAMTVDEALGDGLDLLRRLP